MAIPNSSGVEFYSNNTVFNFLNDREYGLSTTNLFHISFSTPKVLQQIGGNNLFDETSTKDANKMFNVYATSIGMPSKQLMSGQVVDVGSAIKYATGVGYGTCTMTFQMPRNQYFRAFFENWMNVIISDSNNYVEDYSNYICPRIRIYKLERGKGNKTSQQIQFANTDLNERYPVKQYRDQLTMNTVVGCLEIRNAFPQNLGTTQLNGRDARLNTLTVGFNYERYRFFTNLNVGGSSSTWMNQALDKSGKVTKKEGGKSW